MRFRRVLITGGTGSFGQAMTRRLLADSEATVVVLSRGELLQKQMADTFAAERSRLRFFIGDVRDLSRLRVAMADVDCCFHAAALKHVDVGEYNPSEMVATNIHGTENVITACREHRVRSAVLISSDKACLPVTHYGATKMVAESLWVRANTYAPLGTGYAAVRYGNVTGSRGSVLPVWRQALASGRPLPVTDLTMTRFHLLLDEAVGYALHAAQMAAGGYAGHVLIPHLRAYILHDLLAAVALDQGFPLDALTTERIALRTREKHHEQLLSEEEMARAVIYSRDGITPESYYLAPVDPSWPTRTPPVSERHRLGLQAPYRSDSWPDRLDPEALAGILAHIV